jgi:hypothetical protein
VSRGAFAGPAGEQAMSFVGKVLVVVQLLLSVLFMSFAAAVNTAHVNWRNEKLKVDAQLKKTQTELSDEKTAREQDKAKFTEEQTKDQERAGKAEAEVSTLTSELAKLKDEIKNSQREASVASEQAQISGEEAKFRREETLLERETNTKLLASRDEEFKKRQAVQDELTATQIDLAAAVQRNKEILQQLALRDRKLAELGISPDDPSLVANISVPPRVEGKIVGTQGVKSVGGSELVQISLGTDAGLVKGHQLFVWRSGLSNGGKIRYLGKVRIVSTEKDSAVAEVLKQDRGGDILKGDNVSTRLN